jgi:hypothetical protein
VYGREVWELPCFEFRTTVVIELYRLRCPDGGHRAEKVPQFLSKAPFSILGAEHQTRGHAVRGGLPAANRFQVA